MPANTRSIKNTTVSMIFSVGVFKNKPSNYGGGWCVPPTPIVIIKIGGVLSASIAVGRFLPCPPYIPDKNLASINCACSIFFFFFALALKNIAYLIFSSD
jgi:hypothetical protein